MSQGSAPYRWHHRVVRHRTGGLDVQVDAGRCLLADDGISLGAPAVAADLLLVRDRHADETEQGRTSDSSRLDFLDSAPRGVDYERMAHGSCNAEELATILSENLSDVRYDSKTRSGTATIPNVGSIAFHESPNDPAVVLNLKVTKRFKGSAESSLQFLEALSVAWNNSD